MLTILVIGEELFDEQTQTFLTSNDTTITLEHSLLSLSKWESKHGKSFLGATKKTPEEILSYVSEMIISKNPGGEILKNFSEKNFAEINAYIESPQSASVFTDVAAKKGPSETITSELIYYWMVGFNIPFSCEMWHLNRLFALIRICNAKQSKPKKIPAGELAQRNRELNEQRKVQLGTTG